MTIRVVPDAAPSGEVHGAFVLMNDIHGLKQAQEALRASARPSCGSSWTTCRRACRTSTATTATASSTGTTRNGCRREPQGPDRAARSPKSSATQRANQLQPLLDRVLAGETVSTEKLLSQPDGEQRWESIHYAPNRDAEGNVIGIYAVHTDIHDQKRNEEALRRANWMLSSHISNTPLAVLEWDRDFRLVRWSPQAENIFGWRADEVLGMPLTDSPLMHEADREAVAGLVEQADGRRGAARDRPHAQPPQGRRHDLVRVVSLGAARRGGPDRVDPVVRAGRVVAHPGGRAAAVSGHARRADRPAEPAAAARAPDAGDRAGQAQRPPRRRAVHRSRPLQERQRHARPPHRRRAAEARDARRCPARCARPTCWRGWAATSSW